jgi:hypothetical protein
MLYYEFFYVTVTECSIDYVEHSLLVDRTIDLQAKRSTLASRTIDLDTEHSMKAIICRIRF